jgi:hypothetical protein
MEARRKRIYYLIAVGSQSDSILDILGHNVPLLREAM